MCLRDNRVTLGWLTEMTVMQPFIELEKIGFNSFLTETGYHGVTPTLLSGGFSSLQVWRG